MVDEFYARAKEIGLKRATTELHNEVILRSVYEFRFRVEAARALKMVRTTYVERLRKLKAYKPKKQYLKSCETQLRNKNGDFYKLSKTNRSN